MKSLLVIPFLIGMAMVSAGHKPATIIPAGNLAISPESWDMILEFEVGGGETYYNRYLKQPTRPPGASGVTIGIGYDLGYNTKAQIRGDWAGKLPDATIERLCTVSGLKGDMAQAALARVRSAIIPWPSALVVYQSRTVPRFAKLTEQAYPGITRFSPHIQGVMLSTTFNRGSAFSPFAKRKELVWTRDDVATDKKAMLASYQLQMRRLWPTVPGLQRRYTAHAGLMQRGIDQQ